MRLKSLKPSEKRRIEAMSFKHDSVLVKNKRAKEAVLAGSIFGKKKNDEELMKLKNKLAGLPQATLKALKFGQNRIKSAVRKDGIGMLKGMKRTKY